MHMRSLLWPSAFRVPSKRAPGRVTGGPVAGARSPEISARSCLQKNGVHVTWYGTAHQHPDL